MANKLLLSLGLLLLTAATVLAQTETTAFTEFKNQSADNILPDFSYAGYHHGETRIPKVNSAVFNVVDYGAIANDDISDKTAIQNTINAAAASNQPAIVFFPEGRFIIADATDDKFTPLKINSSNIVLRGSGSGTNGTELFMKTYNVPQVVNSNPAQPDTLNNQWKINPGIFLGYDDGTNAETFITSTNGAAAKGTFTISVTNASSSLLQVGKWVLLTCFNTDLNTINAELAPQSKQTSMTNLTAVKLNVYHQIAAISGNQITFKEPLIYDITTSYAWSVKKANNIEEVGIEDILFTGNWKRPFVHHRTWQDDSAWVIFDLARITNSWISNCIFKDVNRIGFTRNSGCISFTNNQLQGNAGHEAFSSGGSWTFIGKNADNTYKSGNLTGQQHSFGVVEKSAGAVLWRNTYPASAGFESHAAQPRNTLLDVVEGGLYYTKAGGAKENLPHHMQNLVMWNYNRTNGNSSVAPTTAFSFWSAVESTNIKMAPVTIVGMHGVPTTFLISTTKRVESNGTAVFPESLYEAQLKLRLGYQPGWLNELYKSQEAIVYNQTDFNGQSISVGAGSYLQADLVNLGIANNTIASLKIPIGYRIELFTGDNFSGTSFTYQDGNNAGILDASIASQVSSIKITVHAIGFDESDGAGISKMNFDPGSYTTFTGGFDNKFSSFLVPNGYKLTIYSGSNFGGNNQIITGTGAVINLNSQLNNFGSSLKLESTSSVLPILLADFKVTPLQNGNKISWRTLSETNSSYTDVVRYSEEKLATTLVSIPSKGNSSKNQEYSFTDYVPEIGVNYYELKQVDFDGKSQNYGPIALQNSFSKSNANFSILNIGSGLKIIYSGINKGFGELNLYNASGVSLFKSTLNLTGKADTITIPKPSAGFYLITLTTKDINLVKKIVIN